MNEPNIREQLLLLREKIRTVKDSRYDSQMIVLLNILIEYIELKDTPQ